MENRVESHRAEFKDLKRKDKSITIPRYLAMQPPDVAEELAPLLHFDMFEAWLRTTTTRRAKDWIRKKNAQKRRESLYIEPPDDIEEDDSCIERFISRAGLEGQVLFKEIIKAFDPLSEKQKQICTLYYVDGDTDREIGERLRMKLDAVTQARTRAMKEVREILRRWGYR